MYHPGRALALLALLAAGGCVKLDSYNCLQSSECQNGGIPGTCELGGWCSFPDVACASGKKYGDFAGEQSGQCVDGLSDTTGAPTSTPTDPDPDTSSSTSTTFDPTTETSFDPTFPMTEVTVSTTSSTDPTTSEPSETTVAPTCGEIGQPCVDGACCGECAVCDGDGICNPPPAGQDMCGVCSFCGGDGNCALASADTPCPADCADIVWKEVVGMTMATCYAYDPMPTQGTCDGDGACVLPDPVEARCPEPELADATVLAKCEVICHEDMHPCVPGGPAAAVDMDAFCYLQSQTPGCTDTCSDDGTFVNPASCVDGICVHTEADECGPYYCDTIEPMDPMDPTTVMCLDGCTANSDCALGVCTAGKCV